MTSKEMSISCIIPMYNEEDNVARIIRDAEGVFSQLGMDWEIIIIESGSDDGKGSTVCDAFKRTDR